VGKSTASKRKKQIGEPFLFVRRRWVDSEAFKKLPDRARTVLLFMSWECFKAPEDADGTFSLPYRQMKPWMAHKTFWRAIRDLQDAGFVEVVEPGFFMRDGERRKPTVYRFSNAWKEPEIKRKVDASLVRENKTPVSHMKPESVFRGSHVKPGQ